MVRSGRQCSRAVTDRSSENHPTAEYRRALESGLLRFQRCQSCGAAFFYPRMLCPACGAEDWTWETSTGTGTVYSVTEVTTGSADPYNITLVDLSEGFRMLTRIDGATPSIGASVRFSAELSSGPDARPIFTLVEQADR